MVVFISSYHIGIVLICIVESNNWYMKKGFLLIGFGICSYFTASAQWITGGPELGVNFSNLKTRVNGVNGNSESRVGLKFGGVLDIAIEDNFSIQPGLFYSVKGAKQDYIVSTQNESGVITTHEIKNDYRINYLEIPINFQYKFGAHRSGQFFIGGGPYLAIALGGKVTNDDITIVDRPNGVSTVTDRSTEYNLRIGNNANTDDVKKGDMGINLNLGYQFAGGLFLRGNLGLGLMNIMPGGDEDNYMRNNSFAVSIGYFLR